MVQAQGRILVDAILKQQSINTEQVTSNRVRRLIKQLKLNASPAEDGITAEHLVYALDSKIIQGRIYYEANEASASGPHHLGGPHQNFNAVSKVNFFIA